MRSSWPSRAASGTAPARSRSKAQAQAQARAQAQVGVTHREQLRERSHRRACADHVAVDAVEVLPEEVVGGPAQASAASGSMIPPCAHATACF